MPSFTTTDILTSSPIPASIQSSAIGILIVSVANSGSNIWQYDLDTAGSGSPTVDISNVSLTNGIFIEKSGSYNIILNSIGGETTTDLIKFYIVTSGTFVTTQRYNPINILDNLYQTYYYGYDGTIDVTSEPLFEYPTNFVIVQEEVTPIYTYTPEQIKTLYNYFEESKVVNQAKDETIASEVTTFLDTNNHLPQFKSYNDYIAYKRSLTSQNYLFNRYK